MSEPLFSLVVVLAFASVMAARRRPAWLPMTGALAAVGYMVRLNGLVLAVALLIFAIIELRAHLPMKRLAKWLVAGFVCATVVSAPYLSWRADYLPSPFYMGQNGDIWADEFWGANSFHDASGDHYLRYRTFSEYRENHTAMDALGRLWISATMQVRDFATETSSLLIVGGLAGGWALVRGAIGSRRYLFALFAVSALVLPLAWIYPLVASTRYFHPTYPFLAVVGVAALSALVRDARRRTGIACVGAFIGLALIWRAFAGFPDAGTWVASHPNLRALIAIGCLIPLGAAALASRGPPKPSSSGL